MRQRTARLLASAILTALGASGVRAAPASLELSTTAFNSESCRVCHAGMRVRRPGPIDSRAEPIAAGYYDAVVVGGGISGLTAAYYLRDYRLLVLDTDPQVGGEARLDSFDGRLDPLSRMVVDASDPPVRDLLKSMKIKTRRAAGTRHALQKDGNAVPDWITGDPSRLPYPKPAQARIAQMQEMLRDTASSRKLSLPVDSIDPQTLSNYEPYSFFQWIDNNYGPEASALAELYSRDLFGVSGREISAAAGLLCLSSEFAANDAWDGGLDAVRAALAASLGPALSTGTYVWNVSQDLEGATVDFTRNGRDYRARARTAVLAVPALIASRIATGLSDRKRSALSKVRYSSFLVTPLRLRRVRWKDSLIYWTPGRAFTDLSAPEKPLSRDATGQVLVAYAPTGEAEGRRMLLSATDRELAAQTAADLDFVLDGASSEIDRARVVRWGHAVPVPYPGYLSQVRPEVAEPEGRLFFAGVETQLPSFQGAVHSGVLAAAAARRFLKSRQTVVPEPAH